MARDGFFFRSCATLSRRGTPAVALVFQGVWSMVLVLTGSYSKLLTYTTFASVFFGGLTVAAVYWLRFSGPDAAASLSLLGLPLHARDLPGDLRRFPDLRDSGRPPGNDDRGRPGADGDSLLRDVAIAASVARNDAGGRLIEGRPQRCLPPGTALPGR